MAKRIKEKLVPVAGKAGELRQRAEAAVEKVTPGAGSGSRAPVSLGYEKRGVGPRSSRSIDRRRSPQVSLFYRIVESGLAVSARDHPRTSHSPYEGPAGGGR